MMARAGMLLLTGLSLLFATACGITVDETARDVRPPPGPYLLQTPAAPSASPTGSAVEQLYFVRDDKLVAVPRKVSSLGTPQHQLTDLLAGPTEDEKSAGLTSALPGSKVIGGIRIVNEVATVVLDPGLADTGRNDEVLAFGQVVCTLDARPDISGVMFEQDGRVVAVPRSTGEVSAGPLTTADYAALLT